MKDLRYSDNRSKGFILFNTKMERSGALRQGLVVPLLYYSQNEGIVGRA